MRVIRAADRTVLDIVSEVAACVRSGGTIIFPTETVSGIGCAPEDEPAIDAIFRAKGRATDKPLALHIADRFQAQAYVAALNSYALEAMERLWPGPVAIIVRRNAARFERASGGFATISLRCPDDDLCNAILRAAGPLAATSANRSGHPPFTGDAADLCDLPEATLVVLAGPTTLGRESTIIDCAGESPLVVREGAVSASRIWEKLGTSPPAR